MNTALPQEQLTTWLVETMSTGLANFDVLVGDGVAPEAGGWTQGQPGVGTSEFVPYITVVGGAGTPEALAPSLTDRFADWRMNYQLRSTGASRRQVDWTGDRGLDLVIEQRGTRLVLNDESWKIIDIRVPMMGAPSRTDTTDPPYWETSDSVELWVSRG